MASPGTESLTIGTHPGSAEPTPPGAPAWTSDAQGSREQSHTSIFNRVLYFSIAAKCANIYLPKIPF